MDPTTNPYAPGAGTRPPELAGREQILQDASTAVRRIGAGRSARGQLLLGLRGVGKTVLLGRIEEMAEAEKHAVISIEAPESRSLADLLVRPLRRVLLRLDRGERRNAQVRRALDALHRFASVFKVSLGELEIGVDAPSGLADSGDLEADLPELLMAVASAAQEAGTAVVLIIDEVQYLASADLGALIVAIHKIAQRGLPLLLFGAGLPQLAALAGDAKSYAERLFDYPDVGPLTPDAAREALEMPARRMGVSYAPAALDAIIDTTRGYPYFLQEWGKHAWNVAGASPIDTDDARRATESAIRQLDAGFFRVRLDRLTPREREYMAAMASLGAGPHRSGEVARAMGESATTVGPIRQGLIRKGMIYSPAYGDTAFTVPMFDEFMRRTTPPTFRTPAHGSAAGRRPRKPGR